MIEMAGITMDGPYEPPGLVLPRVCRWIHHAAGLGISAIVFPELVLGHYHGQTISLHGPELTHLRNLVHQLSVNVAIGIGEEDKGKRYSTYVYFSPDRTFTYHRKTRWQTTNCPIDLGDRAEVHDFAGMKVGTMICSESRFPDVARDLQADGAELLIMPFAYGEAIEPIRDPSWQPVTHVFNEFVARRAEETNLPTLAVAATGVGDRMLDGVRYLYRYHGGFCLINSTGRIVECKLTGHPEMFRFRANRVVKPQTPDHFSTPTSIGSRPNSSKSAR